MQRDDPVIRRSSVVSADVMSRQSQTSGPGAGGGMSVGGSR